MILTGNCQFKYELRLKTVKALINNWNIYDNEELNLYSAWDSIKEEVLESVKTGTYSSLKHIYSLSNLLGCRIVSTYRKTINPCVNRNFFNKTIFQIENKFPNTFLPITWTHITNVKLAGWSPNHFVPCVKKVFVKAKATLYGNVNPDRKCQKQRRTKKLHSFFNCKKKTKIPKENASERTESNKTKVFKRKETNENVSTSKENKDKVINNIETKDKAFNGKADDKISKSKETIRRPFSESDTDESYSRKKEN